MKKLSLFFIAFLFSSVAMAGHLTTYVNPYIGTGGHGHVFLGANVPFGFVQVGPTEHTRGWDWCSGYHYSDSVLVGFSQLHLSGTGIGDLGDITLFPTLDVTQREARFSHNAERVCPGYYSLTLNGSGIHVELTATKRVAFHRYSFPADAKQCYLILNLLQGIGWDNVSSCFYTQTDDKTITGYRFSYGWAKNQKVFFAAKFSRPVTMKGSQEETFGFISFPNSDAPMLVKIGLSAVSEANALANINAEIPSWNFNATVAEADSAWEKELSKIQVNTDDVKTKRIFYTCLYHTMIAPSVFCDVNGDYRGADGNVHHGDFINYTTFSLWDTYRAAHPLSTIIHPDMQKDIALTMLHICDEQGKLPVWHLMGNETDCMVGNPGIPVITDIALKGYDVDRKAVLSADIKSAMRDDRSLDLLKRYGYIPFDKDSTHETVAKGLEYALADGCVAKLAKSLGKNDDYKYFYKRSQSYKHYLDRSTGFMRGVSSDGNYRTPFNPFHAVHRQDDYTEGNAWQYTWLVPHDVHGLVNAMGGEKRFVTKLDSLFIVNGDMGQEASPDISGLIGQYAHGNEPSHHIIYMYNYVGQPWKAAPLLRRVMTTLYRDSIDGLCGNEDVGQMSAWYVLSSVGLYQVEPAGGRYVFGTPLFNDVTINVGHGKTFRIIANGNSKKNIYIQSARLNGKRYTRSYIDFKDIMNGGTLEFDMGSTPSKFGSQQKDRP
jgi:predicted alpha-1,2-mannosidase